MATIEDLKIPSIREMSGQDLFQHILKVRSSRLQAKTNPKKEIKREKTQSTFQAKVVKKEDKLISKLTPAQIEELLKKLGG